MTSFLERIGLRETQLDRAAKLSNNIYRNLKLDGLSMDAKIIKLALFVDIVHKTGDEIELDTVFKLVGGKLQLQAIREKFKAKGNLDNLSMDELIK